MKLSRVVSLVILIILLMILNIAGSMMFLIMVFPRGWNWKAVFMLASILTLYGLNLSVKLREQM